MSEAGAARAASSRPAPGPAPEPGQRPEPPAEGLGVYVHIPFCARRCDYCAFATWTDLHHLAAAYVDACLTELNRAYDAGLGPAATVFVGGGTPSQLPGDELARLLGGIRLLEGAEVTVECNPEDVSTGLLRTYAAAGVTRISIGVQSLVPHVLDSLGRRYEQGAVTRRSRPSARSDSTRSAWTSSTERQERPTATGRRRSRACSASIRLRRT